MEYLGWILFGIVIGEAVGALVTKWIVSRTRSSKAGEVSELLRKHFNPLPMNDITISQRQFPFRVRADLQRAIDRLFGETTRIRHFCGVRREFSHDGVILSDCIVESQHSPTLSTPPEYEGLDIGEGQPIRVLQNGLWLLEKDGVNFAVLLAPIGRYGQSTGMQFQIASPNSEKGTKVAQEFFSHLEDSILKSESYRGKILSLEQSRHSYTGQSNGIVVRRGNC